MSPSDVPFYEIRILCCELSKILFGVSCYQDGKVFLGGTMQDRESVFLCYVLLYEFGIEGFNIREDNQLIDGGCISDVHCLGKLRICILPLLGRAAEERQIQKICFAGIHETLLHLTDVEFRNDHILNSICLDVVVRF